MIKTKTITLPKDASFSICLNKLDEEMSIKKYVGILVEGGGWHSDKRQMVWKGKDMDLNRSLFVLHVLRTETDVEDMDDLLPTPTARCWNMGTNKERTDGISRRSELNHLIAQENGKNTQLSPKFVMEMMGFPIDWTSLPFNKI